MGFSYIVEPVVFLTFMTMYMEMSAVQQLFTEKVCLQHGYDEKSCENSHDETIAREAASWISGYNTTLSLTTLIVSLWFGSWADRYGRKKMMLLPVFGSIVSTLNFILSSYYIKVSPISLIASAVFVGLSTGSLGISSTCFGLVSDVTAVDRRSVRIAFLEASIFFGGAFGFYTVGFLLPKLGFVVIFSVELTLIVLMLFYIVFVVAEPERSRQHSTSSMLNVNHVLSMGRTVFRPREQNYRLVVLLLMSATLGLSYGLSALSYLTYTFLRSPPISWDVSEYSFYHGAMIAIQGFALVVGLPLCLKLFKFKDTTTGFLGSLSRLLGLAWLSGCTESWMVYLTVLLLSLSEFATPSVRSLLSKVVGPNEKGQAFAFMSALQSFAFLTGSQLFLGLYPTTSEELFNGFGFALGAVIQAVPLIVFAYLHFALDLDSRPLPLCADDETARYDSTEESIHSVTVS